MKILILDDEPERHDGFRAILAEHELHHAHSSVEFRELFAQHAPFDMICLDHDLGEKLPGMYGSSEITGEDVAKWLCRQSRDKLPRKVLIHSWNVMGAERIAKALLSTIDEVRIVKFAAPTPRNKS